MLADDSRNRRMQLLAACIVMGLCSVVLSVGRSPLVVWNATASAPVGLYYLRPRVLVSRGDLVLAEIPAMDRRLAASRGYLPENVPIIKRIAALAGDRVCAHGSDVTINGQLRAVRFSSDGQGRPLPNWEGCRTLSPCDVFLLNGDILHSFDGRYFGLTTRTTIVGKLVALWTS